MLAGEANAPVVGVARVDGLDQLRLDQILFQPLRLGHAQRLREGRHFAHAGGRGADELRPTHARHEVALVPGAVKGPHRGGTVGRRLGPRGRDATIGRGVIDLEDAQSRLDFAKGRLHVAATAAISLFGGQILPRGVAHLRQENLQRRFRLHGLR